MRSQGDPLLLEIVAWIAARGRITEGWRADPDDPKRLWLRGIAGDRDIHINPLPDTLEVVVHEVLHVVRPTWTERGVRRKTRALLKHMNDGEIQTLWGIYQERLQRERKRGRRPAPEQLE